MSSTPSTDASVHKKTKGRKTRTTARMASGPFAPQLARVSARTPPSSPPPPPTTTPTSSPLPQAAALYTPPPRTILTDPPSIKEQRKTIRQQEIEAEKRFKELLTSSPVFIRIDNTENGTEDRVEPRTPEHISYVDDHREPNARTPQQSSSNIDSEWVDEDESYMSTNTTTTASTSSSDVMEVSSETLGVHREEEEEEEVLTQPNVTIDLQMRSSLHDHEVHWLQPEYDSYLCDCCKERDTGMRYHCNICSYDLCKECATITKIVEEDSPNQEQQQEEEEIKKVIEFNSVSDIWKSHWDSGVEMFATALGCNSENGIPDKPFTLTKFNEGTKRMDSFDLVPFEINIRVAAPDLVQYMKTRCERDASIFFNTSEEIVSSVCDDWKRIVFWAIKDEYTRKLKKVIDSHSDEAMKVISERAAFIQQEEEKATKAYNQHMIDLGYKFVECTVCMVEKLYAPEFESQSEILIPFHWGKAPGSGGGPMHPICKKCFDSIAKPSSVYHRRSNAHSAGQYDTSRHLHLDYKCPSCRENIVYCKYSNSFLSSHTSTKCVFELGINQGLPH